jgi:GAF domain-containing protein
VVESRAFSDPRLHEGYPVRRAALNEGFVGWVAATHDDRGARRLRRPALSPLGDGLVAEARAQSFVGVPIIQDGHSLGVLSFASARPLRLGAEERELLDTLVGQAALAMRNARLFAATEGASARPARCTT